MYRKGPKPGLGSCTSLLAVGAGQISPLRASVSACVKQKPKCTLRVVKKNGAASTQGPCALRGLEDTVWDQMSSIRMSQNGSPHLLDPHL